MKTILLALSVTLLAATASAERYSRMNFCYDSPDAERVQTSLEIYVINPEGPFADLEPKLIVGKKTAGFIRVILYGNTLGALCDATVTLNADDTIFVQGIGTPGSKEGCVNISLKLDDSFEGTDVSLAKNDSTVVTCKESGH